jgi:hypothetical protein
MGMYEVLCSGCEKPLQLEKHTVGARVWCKECAKNGFTWDPVTGKTEPILDGAVAPAPSGNLAMIPAAMLKVYETLAERTKAYVTSLEDKTNPDAVFDYVDVVAALEGIYGVRYDPGESKPRW